MKNNRTVSASILLIFVVAGSIFGIKYGPCSNNSDASLPKNTNSLISETTTLSNSEKTKNNSEKSTDANGSDITSIDGKNNENSEKTSASDSNSSVTSAKKTVKARYPYTTEKASLPVVNSSMSEKEISNVNRINALYSRYGIIVQTGEDADIYDYGATTEIRYHGCNDAELIGEWLDAIEEFAAMYPSGFFKNFNDLSVVTFKIYDGKSTTPYAFTSTTYMYIGLNTKMFETEQIPVRIINHEFFHLIETYIVYKASWKGIDNPFDATENYNPSGFAYGSISSSDYVGTYFVTKYSKNSPKEDRAEMFAEYIYDSSAQSYMKDKSSPISKKMLIIISVIRDYFPSAASQSKGSLRWERFVYA